MSMGVFHVFDRSPGARAFVLNACLPPNSLDPEDRTPNPDRLLR